LPARVGSRCPVQQAFAFVHVHEALVITKLVASTLGIVAENWSAIIIASL
jgi:hypothetical protein